MSNAELAAAAAKAGLSLVSSKNEIAGKTPMLVEASKEVSPRYTSAAVNHDTSAVVSVRYNMGSGVTKRNDIIQIDITNSQAGAVDELVRIGSRLGLADAYIRYGTTKSGVDSVNGISDNFGINLQKCQGFSEIVSDTPVFVKVIKLISSNTTQLNTQFQHKTILPDFTIIPLVQNIAFTREKSDQATDLLVAEGSWLLSSRNFLEFTSKASRDLQIIMQIASVADVRNFVAF